MVWVVLGLELEGWEMALWDLGMGREVCDFLLAGWEVWVSLLLRDSAAVGLARCFA